MPGKTLAIDEMERPSAIPKGLSYKFHSHKRGCHLELVHKLKEKTMEVYDGGR